MSTATLARELCTLTYTPTLCCHLDNLRRSYAAQADMARNRVKECNISGDSEGVKIAQVDLTLATIGLAKVEEHLILANREWTR